LFADLPDQTERKGKKFDEKGYKNIYRNGISNNRYTFISFAGFANGAEGIYDKQVYREI